MDSLNNNTFDPHVDTRPRNFLDSSDKGTILGVTFIPLTGSRTKDNYLSFAMAAITIAATEAINAQNGDWASIARDLGKDAIDEAGIIAKNGVQAGFVWHHNEIMGVMEYMTSDEHAETNHTGGVALWEIINNQDYT